MVWRERISVEPKVCQESVYRRDTCNGLGRPGQSCGSEQVNDIMHVYH
jgi:hypothetical protein